MRGLRRTVAMHLLVVFCAIVLLTGCGRNPAANNLLDIAGDMNWNVRGVQQVPTETAWAYSWDQSYVNSIVGASCTIVENRAYQGGQGLLELDLKTGKELLNTNWTKKNHMFLQGSPVVCQGRVYGILSEQKTTEMPGVGLLYQRLSCLDAATGKILWQSDEIGTGEKPCGSQPLLLGGKIYLAACFPVPPSGNALETDVHAAVGIWDATTGRLTGRISLPKGAFPGYTHLVSDGTFIYGNACYEYAWSRCRSSLFRYDPATAEMGWSISYPATSKDFTNIYTALAVDSTTLVAVFQTEDQPQGVINGVFTNGARRRVVAAFDTVAGHSLWTKTEEIPPTLLITQYPCVALQQGIAFFTVHDGTLTAVHERTGTQRWSFVSGAAAWCCNLVPMATRDVLYVREGQAYLVALDPSTGVKLWQKTLLTPEEWDSETRELCDIVPVDKGLIVVTANTSDLRPIIEFWK